MTAEYSRDELQSVAAGGDEDLLRQHASDLDYLRTDPRLAALVVARVLLYPDTVLGHH